MKLIVLFLFLSACSSIDKKEKSPDELKADLFYSHGTAKLVNKEYTKALDYLLKAYAIRPDDSHIANNLGMAYFFKKEFDKATIYLEKALLLDEKNSDARINLASLYFRFKKYDQSAREYEKVLQDLVYEHQYRAYYGLALVLLKQNRPSEAYKHLDSAIKNKEDYCAAHFKLGELAKKAYDYNEAYKRFRMASQGVCFQEPSPHYEQALTLIEMNDFKKANGKFKEIIELFPNTIYAKRAINDMEKLNKKLNSTKIISPEF